jgi:Na+/H+ antiporter NhaC
MMPIAITVAYKMLSTAGPAGAADPVLLATVGSVLAGAVFGDHCSPISDTTVLSSQASGCDHLQHVATQLPYALVVAAASIVLGTLPAGWGQPGWVLSLFGLPALVLILFTFGRRAAE